MATQTERLGLNIPSDGDYVADEMFWNENIEKIEESYSTIETRTTDPSSPVVGRMWLRIDL